MTALHDLTLADAARAVSTGELCPVEYTRCLVNRVENHDARIHSLIDLFSESALARAKSLKQTRGRAEVPPLFGIPFLAKDNIDITGYVTSNQSRAGSTSAASQTALCVQRLLDAGAICLGKTSMDEFALAGPYFDAPWPATRNPWNPDYTPGSSSSGSGAALAAGFAPLALGSDTGGSIRSPAMMNGVVGLKPTFGGLPMVGVFPLAPSMDTVGPMTRTVGDLAIAYACLAETGGTEPPTLARPPRLARVDGSWREKLDCSPDVLAAFDQALSDLSDAGAVFGDASGPSLDTINTTGWVTLYAEAYQLHKDKLAKHPDLYGHLLRTQLLQGALIGIGDYIDAQHLRAELTGMIDDILDGVDGIILPVSALPPCPMEDEAAMSALGAASLRLVCNVTGHPAIALPMGLSAAGLPVGVQIIGPKNREAQLIAVAQWVEDRLTGWRAGSLPNLEETDAR